MKSSSITVSHESIVCAQYPRIHAAYSCKKLSTAIESFEGSWLTISYFIHQFITTKKEENMRSIKTSSSDSFLTGLARFLQDLQTMITTNNIKRLSYFREKILFFYNTGIMKFFFLQSPHNFFYR